MQLSETDRANISDRLLMGGADGGAIVLNQMLMSGTPLRDIYLDILTPVARHFDVLWSADEHSFLSIKVATVRIEEYIRETSTRSPQNPQHVGKRAIFANVPGDAHTLGVKMAAALQCSKGWEVHVATDQSYSELLHTVETSSAEILGLSLGTEASMHMLYNLVRTVRVLRPSMKILVSGSLVSTDAEPIRTLGVDAYTKTFEQAEIVLERFASQSIGQQALNLLK